MSQIEGRRPVLEALRADRPIEEILVARDLKSVRVLLDIRTLARDRGVKVREVPLREIDERARTGAPQGVIAFVGEFRYATLAHVLKRAPSPALFVALDGVTDPRNLGALARSAEAAGAHGLLVMRRRTAPVTAVAEKAAAGALAHLAVAQVPNLERALDELREAGVWIAALDEGAGQSIYDIDLWTEPVCLVVGDEGKGVSRLVRERADVRARIPTSGKLRSLNASVAGAVALFEIARRRA